MAIINVLNFAAEMLIVAISTFLFFAYKVEEEPYKYVLIASCIIVLLFCSAFMWVDTLDKMLLNILLLTYSYSSICFFNKKASFSINSQTIIFFIVSIVFLWWVTVLFGKLYMDNNIEESYGCYSQIAKIINDGQFFIVMNIRMSAVYLSVGIEHYFIIPSRADINDLQFLQFIFSFIAGGTIIAAILSVITRFIAPFYNKATT